MPSSTLGSDLGFPHCCSHTSKLISGLWQAGPPSPAAFPDTKKKHCILNTVITEYCTSGETFCAYCRGTLIAVGVQQSAFLPWQHYGSRAGSQDFTNLYQSDEDEVGGRLPGTRAATTLKPLSFQTFKL